jgi:hypothetical protein
MLSVPLLCGKSKVLLQASIQDALDMADMAGVNKLS